MSILAGTQRVVSLRDEEDEGEKDEEEEEGKEEEGPLSSSKMTQSDSKRAQNGSKKGTYKRAPLPGEGRDPFPGDLHSLV